MANIVDHELQPPPSFLPLSYGPSQGFTRYLFVYSVLIISSSPFLAVLVFTKANANWPCCAPLPLSRDVVWPWKVTVGSGGCKQEALEEGDLQGMVPEQFAECNSFMQLYVPSPPPMTHLYSPLKRRSLPCPGYSVWNPCGIHRIYRKFHYSPGGTQIPAWKHYDNEPLPVYIN